MSSVTPNCLSGKFSWHPLYQAALFETDSTNLPRLIIEAENAILARAQELFASDSDSIEEDVAMDDALYVLRALRTCRTMEAKAA
jgi:hypothetical protein